MKRNPSIIELMDDPDCDPDTLHRTYKQFGFVNRLFSNWRAIYQRLIKPQLNDKKATYTLLDVGCGLMDNSKYIQRLAFRDGYQIHITGLDPNPVVKLHFAKMKPEANVQFIPSYLHELDVNQKYDFIISNHLLHHLDDSQITELHQEISQRTRKLAIMNDIHRSVWAYIGFSLITIPYIGWSFIHIDGRRSIRRSFTSDELNHLLPIGWDAMRVAPFRLLGIYEAI
jgi:2-polyprenyl-3-methyl-5-hydroxy-6-metoxy-1,4-benzoquinol methylase